MSMCLFFVCESACACVHKFLYKRESEREKISKENERERDGEKAHQKENKEKNIREEGWERERAKEKEN